MKEMIEKIREKVGKKLNFENVFNAMYNENYIDKMARPHRDGFTIARLYICCDFWEWNDICFWKYNKTLEEQSAATIKAIYDILVV